MKFLENIAYAEFESCKYDMYLPDAENFSTVIFFHGGGLTSGNKFGERFSSIGKNFVQHGYAFVSVEYRKYPNAKYPEFLEDAAAAVAHVKNNIGAYGGNGKLYVSGASAGAWLSTMICLNKQYLAKHGIDSEDINGWIIDSAQMTAHFNVLKFELNEDEKAQRINEFAPLYFVNQQTKFSKMLLFFYDKDMPTRPEGNLLFIKTVKNFNPSADITYQFREGGHCYASVKKDEDGEFPFVKETIKWLNERGE